MATQEMILKLSFDDEGTFTGLSDINQQLAKTDEATKAVEKSTKTLKAQYADLKKQQDQMDPGTEKFNQLSMKMGELKDRMNDAAEAVKGNTGPAIEGMSNTFGIMGEQLSNLDFEGLTQSIQTFSGNLGRIDTKALAGGMKAAFQAGIAGAKALAITLYKNPIFILVGVLIAVIAYWEELSDFVTGKSRMLENLNKQGEALKAQEQSLTRELALQKALGVGGGQILKTELDILRNKQNQAEVAMKIAFLEKDREAFLAAQQQQLTAINDIELRKIKVYTDTKALLDKIRAGKDDEYNKQLLQNEAFSVFKNQTEQITLQQKDLNAQSTRLAIQMSSAQKAGNKALEEKLRLQREGLLNHVKDLQGQKDEIWNAGMQAQAEVKTEKELAAIAARKAKQAERKSAADAASKKLADDILAIEKNMEELQRASMDDQEKELFTMFQRQQVEEQTFIKAKKSADELAQLRATHEAEFATLTAKYDQIEADKDAEKLAKEKEAAQERLNEKQLELIELQSIIDAADEGNFQAGLSKQEQELMASQDYYFQLKEQALAAGVDAQALVDEQARKENEIKKKYRDEDAANRMANIQQGFEITEQGMTALSALGDAYFSTQLANLQAGSKAELDLKKKQFAFNKKMQIGGAIMDTAKAITAAVAANPFPSPTLPISIALASITGAAQIAKIASTKFDGGSGAPAPPSIPTGGGNAPAIDFSGANIANNAPGGLETYVLAGNVANALEARQKIIDQSHL